MVEVAESCSPWIRGSPSRSTCSKGARAGHPHPARVHDRCSGGRYTRRLRAHHGRLPKHLALAVRAVKRVVGTPRGLPKARSTRRRVKGTPNGLTARLSPNCCLAKIAYRRSRRVSCSYGTFLEHPISARVGKWLSPNKGATSTRQKIGARGCGDLLFRHSPYRICRYELPRCLAAEWFREIETLGQIAPHDRQARHLPFVLHSFGGHLEAERMCEVHDQAHDSVVDRIFPRRSTNDLSNFKPSTGRSFA
jgi:hypothetical protein